jgi:hypothetical protein
MGVPGGSGVDTRGDQRHGTRHSHPLFFPVALSSTHTRTQRINRAYYLPPWCSGADYEALLAEAGLAAIRRDDWSASVAPFWGAVIRSALSVKGIRGLFGAGWKTIKVWVRRRKGRETGGGGGG